MRSVIAAEKHDGKKIDKVIRDFFPNLQSGMLFKALRKKDVKVNGARVREDYTVSAGDKLDIYIIDDFLLGKDDEGYEIVYEDENLLVVNKAQGVPVHPDDTQKEATLIDKLQSRFGQDIELCHRLDRNTCGLVILAKNKEAVSIMLEKIKNREIKKLYTCIVVGQMEARQAELRDYLEKNDKISKVFVSKNRTRSSVEIITKYRVIKETDDLSLLEVDLVTGRTHQIRAHLAFYGHPILGDGKYGRNQDNKMFNVKQQLLCASKLTFEFTTPSGRLGYLNGKSISITPPFSIDKL